ncbi:hypothetical protein WJX72_012042 [[Myrmecia] bisecta]|uniref:DUF1990 domain-containing protein n=1 Tax=[Myrmecia] bisecta TaxID=41462 RepID=A0AAW1QGU3_9CHLO
MGVKPGFEFFTLFRKPSQQEIQTTFDRAATRDANHNYVGLTEDDQLVPKRLGLGWSVDHHRAKVGKGRKAYQRAQSALRRWQHMQLGWVETTSAPVATGELVCVAHRAIFAWLRNPLKVVYATEGKVSLRSPAAASQQLGRGQRFKFGQTTLDGHVIAGEERFTLEWHHDDDSVWYDIFTISRPATALSLLSYPISRFYQHRFRVESTELVRRAAEGQVL